MKRRGATLEHAQPQRARAELDSDSLSTLRRFIALPVVRRSGCELLRARQELREAVPRGGASPPFPWAPSRGE